jgi:hypothetical protein
MRQFHLIVCTSILILPANAQSNALGYGLTSCGEFVSTYQPQQSMTIFTWASGYFTGANLATESKRHRDLAGLTDPAFVVTRLLDHCTRNPRGVLLEAVQKIYLSLPLIASDATAPNAKPALAH